MPALQVNPTGHKPPLLVGCAEVAPPVQKYPGAQVPETALCPTPEQNFPTGQGRQLVLFTIFTEGEYVPAGHRVGVTEPAGQ